MLPETFAEQHVRIYSKRSDEISINNVRKAFRKWCSIQHCTTPKVSVVVLLLLLSLSFLVLSVLLLMLLLL
jgi:hypothetical protein